MLMLFLCRPGKSLLTSRQKRSFLVLPKDCSHMQLHSGSFIHDTLSALGGAHSLLLIATSL